MTDSAPLTFREKCCYAVGDIANGLAVSATGFWLLIYLTDVAGLGPALAGIVMMSGRAWDAFTDPIMGWISDHTKSRHGKRRVFLLYGAVTYALSFFLIWVIPDFASEITIFIYAFIAVLIFNTCFTVVFLPYTALTAVMTSDYDERTSLTGFRMVASQFSFFVGAVVPSALALWVVSDGGIRTLNDLGISSLTPGWAGTERQAYFLMAVIFALIMLFTIWTAFFWGTKEDSSEDQPTATGGSPLDYLKGIYLALKLNRAFRIAAAIIVLSNTSTTLIAVNLPYYLRYVLDVKEHQTQIVALLFLAAILSLPFWIRTTARFGKTETYRVAMWVFALVVMSLLFVPKGDANMIKVIAVLAGFLYGGALMIPWAIVPDVVEYDELLTSERREGLLFGGTTFCYKFATALAVFISGSVLSVIGYVPNAEQPQSVVTGIRLFMGFGAAIGVFLAGVVAFRYPLNKQKYEEVLDELKAKKGIEGSG